MSSPRRRKELAAMREAEDTEREEENRRKAGLCMWTRIEEADASEDVKDILRRIAEAAGIDMWGNAE